MKRFVVTLEFDGVLPDKETGAAQQEFLRSLHEEGVLIAAGPFSDGSGGMAILRCHSLEEARELYRDSPIVRSGHAIPTVREWNVVMAAADIPGLQGEPASK